MVIARFTVRVDICEAKCAEFSDDIFIGLFLHICLSSSKVFPHFRNTTLSVHHLIYGMFVV